MVAVVIITATFIVLYLNGTFLPNWLKWQTKTENINQPFFDSMVDASYDVILQNKKLSVKCNGEEIWTIAKGVKVQDFIITDIDEDGANDIIILCWRRGKYGSEKPFFVKKNDYSWSQHIFIYTIINGDVRHKWLASDIGMLVKEWEYYGGALRLTDNKDRKSSWIWKGFGLYSVPNDYYL